MGFAIPGIVLNYSEVRPMRNYRKRRTKTNNDSGEYIQPASISALPYNYQLQVVPRRNYEFNRVFSSTMDIRSARQGSERRKRNKIDSLNRQESHHKHRLLTLSLLPLEILLKIIAMSGNINGIKLVDRFFFDLVDLHYKHLLRLFIDYYYLYRMTCVACIDSSLQSNTLTDTEHVKNSLAMTLEEIAKNTKILKRKRRYSGEYTFKDIIVVMDVEAFNQPYIRHDVFREFHADAILPKKEIVALKEEVSKSLANLRGQLQEAYQNNFTSSQRIDKDKLIAKYINETRIDLPFYDSSRPKNVDRIMTGGYNEKLQILRDVLHRDHVFNGNLESMLWFLLELNTSASKEILKTDSAFGKITLKEVKGFLKRQTGNKPPVFQDNDLILCILFNTDKKWCRYLLQFAASASLEEDEYFWSRIMDTKRLDCVRMLEKYAGLGPGPQVINVLAGSSQ
ncbi:hypothetical protein FOA43_001002 [Brettanomyces nanus]|uniref:Uncharacterized protein n=1 Tax=Eeniella nana TaxID=13502 RepID=A0A875S1G5_EENNA|nr:uncharacterized protein FOA43_001002 [Brettanomyces nanus]QPG73689.1 hypothetical protein FOA43_001002 [Brettanomyces nanus]